MIGHTNKETNRLSITLYISRGFNGSVNIPESCDFRSQFDLLNIICKPFSFYDFLNENL